MLLIFWMENNQISVLSYPHLILTIVVVIKLGVNLKESVLV